MLRSGGEIKKKKFGCSHRENSNYFETNCIELVHFLKKNVFVACWGGKYTSSVALGRICPHVHRVFCRQ